MTPASKINSISIYISISYQQEHIQFRISSQFSLMITPSAVLLLLHATQSHELCIRQVQIVPARPQTATGGDHPALNHYFYPSVTKCDQGSTPKI
mmetsp:Transcript_5542/g.9640  ORF Transcript_5542/g.9640 Transcript_5542/m.9640 type:complete len:95 (+) Transcript_5542:949-1233(+)